MNDNTSLVSVVMPVYNAEKYISEAIESVLSQTYTNFELLLINDRSTDHSRKICEEYAQKDNRIILLENDTESHGPGPTRNIGLDNAMGDFIYFMDADDWIEFDLLEQTIHQIETDKSDMVSFGITIEYYGNSRSSQRSQEFEKLIWTKDEIKNNIKEYWKVRSITLWSHLIRRSVIGETRFEDIMVSEDDCFFFDILAKIEIVSYLNKWLYHYRMSSDSTIHKWHPNYLECQHTKWIHEKRFFESIAASTTPAEYADFLTMDYLRIIFEISFQKCPLRFAEKCDALGHAIKYLELDHYRGYINISDKKGFDKVKYFLVKCRLEKLMLIFSPLFLKTTRGE